MRWERRYAKMINAINPAVRPLAHFAPQVLLFVVGTIASAVLCSVYPVIYEGFSAALTMTPPLLVPIFAALILRRLCTRHGVEYLRNREQAHTEYKTQTIFDAIATGDHRTARLLCKRGAGINERNQQGETPLIKAARLANPQARDLLVQCCLDCGADVNATDNAGHSALFYTIANSDLHTAHLLYTHQAALNQSELYTASLLCYQGVDINARNLQGATLLIEAAQNNSLLAARLSVMCCLECGADVKATDHAGNSALFYAIANSDLVTAQLLCERGADINARNRQGETPLIKAANDPTPQICEWLVALLLKYDADVQTQDDLGNSAMHYACQLGYYEIIPALYERYPAVLTQMNQKGETPWDIANRFLSHGDAWQRCINALSQDEKLPGKMT